MVKIFCDRCGTEVDSLDALLQFSLEVTEPPNRSVWQWRAEVCQDCFTTMKEEIAARLSPPSDDKKKGPRK